MSPASQDFARLLAGLTAHLTWRVVLQVKNSKRPCSAPGGGWPLTRDPGPHVERGGNVGLACGESTGLAVVDVDDINAFAELEVALGPLGGVTVTTPSGGRHFYFAWEPNLLGKIVTSDGRVVGDVLRGGVERNQQPAPWVKATCPPSVVCIAPTPVRPEFGGGAYTWGEDTDLTRPLPALPPLWRAYLGATAPVQPPRPTAAPAPATIVEAALRQPGAQRRGEDVKFQCPGCRDLGRDRAQDNARLFTASGKWACAVFPAGTPGSREHWLSIGVALGAFDRATAAILRQRASAVWRVQENRRGNVSGRGGLLPGFRSARRVR